jgi:hypothetical protein
MVASETGAIIRALTASGETSAVSGGGDRDGLDHEQPEIRQIAANRPTERIQGDAPTGVDLERISPLRLPSGRPRIPESTGYSAHSPAPIKTAPLELSAKSTEPVKSKNVRRPVRWFARDLYHPMRTKTGHD